MCTEPHRGVCRASPRCVQSLTEVRTKPHRGVYRASPRCVQSLIKVCTEPHRGACKASSKCVQSLTKVCAGMIDKATCQAWPRCTQQNKPHRGAYRASRRFGQTLTNMEIEPCQSLAKVGAHRFSPRCVQSLGKICACSAHSLIKVRGTNTEVFSPADLPHAQAGAAPGGGPALPGRAAGRVLRTTGRQRCWQNDDVQDADGRLPAHGRRRLPQRTQVRTVVSQQRRDATHEQKRNEMHSCASQCVVPRCRALDLDLSKDATLNA